MKEKKIREIIDKIVPYLNSDGGNLEFINIVLGNNKSFNSMMEVSAYPKYDELLYSIDY